MLVQIKFTKGGSSSVFGNFAPGDVLRCSEAHAKHLVEEAQCAAYVQQAPAEVQPADAKPKSRKAKDTQ